MKRILVAAAFSAPFLFSLGAAAQSTDAQYCAALTSEVRRILGTNTAPDAVSVAMTRCNTAPASSIPVLEKHLTDNKVTLPKR